MNSNLKEQLKKFADENNFSLGVCDASRMDYLAKTLEATQTPFVNSNLELRINPQAVMSSAKSIIAICVPNNKVCEVPSEPLHGRIASIGIGCDYHVKLKNILNEVVSLIHLEHEFKIFVDSGFLVERAVAVRAGLGFIGKNGFLISKNFGSFVNIGYIITDLEIEPDTVFMVSCGNCRKCIEACPSNALTEDGEVICDVKKCVSYLTQVKTEPTDDEKRTMGTWIYGCDACQEVCPRNHFEYEKCEPHEKYPILSELLHLTKEEFEVRYKDNALYWRGFETFRRNVEIAQANMRKGI